MHRRVIRRAAAAALMLLVAMTTSAFAESTVADADVVLTGDQATLDLGSALPGADVPVDVTFRLDCTGTNHVDSGQSVRLSPGPRTIPLGGSFRLGTVVLTSGAGWPTDGAVCPAAITPVTAVHRMIVTAPAVPGTDLRYVFSWTRSLVPTTATDAGVLEGANPTVTFILDVFENTPPALVLPDDSTIQGDTTGGAVAAYDVSATDAEDASAPMPACSPAAGAVLPLGTTTVACSVSDSGGLTADGSFDITVVDTTAPVLAGMPADRSITTADPGGATVTFSSPTATDVVDPTPAVGCAPASGGIFPVGSTTVTCTATDDSGNHVSRSFTVDMALVVPVAWSARWGEPIGTDGATLVANRGRTVPVKVEFFADRVEQTAGDARLDVTTCAGVSAQQLALTWDSGRWTAHLETSGLGDSSCFRVTASLDGQAAGAFRLALGGSATATNRR